MWGTYEINEDIHIIPLGDEKEHIFSGECLCEPRIENNIYIHDAFDGRIAVERANEILTIQNNYKMKLFEKFKAWIKSAGLRSIVYLAAGFAAYVLMGSSFLFGVGVGIFGADNWMTIKELIKK